MAKYLLDLDLELSFFWELFFGDRSNFEIRLRRNVDKCYVSTITLAKLFGRLTRIEDPHLRQQVEKLINIMEIIDFDKEASLEYAKIQDELQARGKSAGMSDVMIAAVVRSGDYILVTDKLSIFKIIDPNLKVESWNLSGKGVLHTVAKILADANVNIIECAGNTHYEREDNPTFHLTVAQNYLPIDIKERINNDISYHAFQLSKVEHEGSSMILRFRKNIPKDYESPFSEGILRVAADLGIIKFSSFPETKISQSWQNIPLTRHEITATESGLWIPSITRLMQPIQEGTQIGIIKTLPDFEEKIIYSPLSGLLFQYKHRQLVNTGTSLFSIGKNAEKILAHYPI